MQALMTQIWLQAKLDFRNKGALLTYYLLPLIFFAFMGGIFTSINPVAKETLIVSMTVFGMSVGGILGLSVMVCESLQSPLRKAYLVGGIPLWSVVLSHMASAFVHLLVTSCVIVAAAPLAFGAVWPPQIWQFIMGLLGTLMTTIVLGAFLGLFMQSASKTSLLAQLIFLPSLMLSGMMFPASMLPQALERLGYLFPATWGQEVMLGGSLRGLLVLGGISLLALLGIGIRLSRMKGE